jgi:predicted transcriptional regulator
MKLCTTLTLSEDERRKLDLLSFAFVHPRNRIVEMALREFLSKNYRAIEEAENSLKRIEKSRT